MLVITRRIGESLVIGDDVVITVLSEQGKHVKLGIVAPKEISVHREEIYDRIQNEKDHKIWSSCEKTVTIFRSIESGSPNC